jgi:hypothetical protein
LLRSGVNWSFNAVQAVAVGIAMGGFTIVSLSALHLQSVGLLDNVDIPWPDAWERVMHYVRLANLDPTQLIDATGLPPVTFHTLYLLFANLLPMAIALAGLIVFQPVVFVVWYAVTAASFVFLGIGLIMKYDLAGTEQDGAWWYVFAGGAASFLCVVVGVTGYFVRHVNDDDDELDAEAQMKSARARDKALAFNGRRTLARFLFTGVCFIVGCVLTGLFVQVPGTSRQTGVLFFMGYALYALAGLGFLTFLLSVSPGGRRLEVTVVTFLKANALLGLLLLISITYVPTIDYCVASYMCADYSCPVGYVFNPRADRPPTSFTRSADVFCDPCVFLDDRCKADGGWLYALPAATPEPSVAVNGSNSSITPTTTGIAPANWTTYNQTVSEYCPAFHSSRLWRFPEIACSDPALQYYLVSSSVVLACYILLVPILYLRLIRRLTTLIKVNVKLVPQSPDDNVEYLPPVEVYKRQVEEVEPAAASLYQPFTLHYRYFSVVLLVYRLLLVAVTGVLAPFYADAGLYTLLGAFIFTLAGLLFTKPFISKTEFVFATALEACNVVNVALAVAIYHGWTPPDEVIYVLFGMNVVLPLVASVATFRFVRERGKKLRRGAAERDAQTKMRGDEEMQQPLITQPSDDVSPTATENGGAENGGSLMTISQKVRKRGLSAVTVPKVAMATKAEEHRINEENATLKRALNHITAEMVTTFFASLGWLLLLATGAAVLGYMKGTGTEFPDGSTRSSRGPMPVLAGYDSFSAMTDNCCCVESRNPAATYNTTERWVCPGNGVVVDRGRRTFDLDDNGLPLRPVCGNAESMTFGCSVTVNQTSNGLAVMVTCPPDVAADDLQTIGVTPFARDYLF